MAIHPDIERAMNDAWDKLLPLLRNDPDEVARRLARRRTDVLTRPLRPYCLAVRAADTRITPYRFIITPEHALSLDDPRHPYEYTEHTVTLNSRNIRHLCDLRAIGWPGEPAERIARRLGCSYRHFIGIMKRGKFEVVYRPRLAGKPGPPTPVIYREGLLDPNAHEFEMPDKFWGTHRAYNAERVPDGIEQTLTRRPVCDGWRGRNRRPDCFKRWDWVCPGCARQVRVLYFPLPPIMINFEDFLPRNYRRHDFDDRDRGLPTFACTECHNVRSVTRMNKSLWNLAVAAFSGGLLYGAEVQRPAWFYADVVPRRAVTHPKRAPLSPRRAEVLQLLLDTDFGHNRMARALNLHRSTCQDHVKRIYRDHAVKDRHQLRAKLAAEQRRRAIGAA